MSSSLNTLLSRFRTFVNEEENLLRQVTVTIGYKHHKVSFSPVTTFRDIITFCCREFGKDVESIIDADTEEVIL